MIRLRPGWHYGTESKAVPSFALQVVDISGSIRISQKDKVMFSLVNCLQEVFIDATAALVERAGAAMGTSFTGSHLLNGKGCTIRFQKSFHAFSDLRSNNGAFLRG